MNREMGNMSLAGCGCLPGWRLQLVLCGLLLVPAQRYFPGNQAQASDRPYVMAQASAVKVNQNKRVDLSGNGSQSPYGTSGNQQKGGSKDPQILLPEGYFINGRSAVLFKHPKESRWFLKFKPGLKTAKSIADKSSVSRLQAIDTTGFPSRVKPVNVNKNPTLSKMDPFTVPFEILPCQWLTKMTSVSGDQEDSSINFRIWGEVTTYHKRNYILPKNVYVLSLFGKAVKKTKSKAVGGLSELDSLQYEGGLPSKPGKATEGKDGGENELDQSPKIDALRKLLISMPRAQPLMLREEASGKGNIKQGQQGLMPLSNRKPLQGNKQPGVTSQSSKGRAPGTGGGRMRSDMKEGAMVVDRVGRLDYDSDEQMWLFAFESDASHLSEPPIGLLPCRLLEVMERETYQSPQRVKYRVSGRVTKYQNRNYLLLRKVLFVFERGNIGK